MSDFRLGVNYWPARSAMYWWDSFDQAEFARDVGRLADWGFGEVRIFLLWEHFQPAPEGVSATALEELGLALAAAEQAGVGLELSLFCGHMSGCNWLPGWAIGAPENPRPAMRTMSGGRLVGGGAGDIYADERLLDAQLTLAGRLASTFRGHRGLAGWDLGNEFSLIRLPDTPASIASWSAALSEALRPAGVEITGGLHSPDLERDQAIRPSSIARPWDVVSMHGYPIYTPLAEGPTDPELMPFLSATAARLAARPVLAQEFGLPDHELGEERVAEYARATLERLWESGAVGAYWWCFADYEETLRPLPPFDRAPHELHFGLTRADGSPKPVVEAWRSFGRRPVRELVAAPGPDETAWYAGLPETVRAAYAAWLAARPAR